MKQVTGSKSSHNHNNSVSIQLEADGHAFSLAPIEEVNNEEANLSVELLTTKTVLVPNDLLDSKEQIELATKILAINGIYVGSREQAVISKAVDGVRAIMVVCDECYNALAECNAKVNYTSPLLRPLSTIDPTLWLYKKSGYIYIKVSNRTLAIAQVAICGGDADILHVVNTINKDYPTTQLALIVEGDNSSAAAKVIDKYYKFKSVQCE